MKQNMAHIARPSISPWCKKKINLNMEFAAIKKYSSIERANYRK